MNKTTLIKCSYFCDTIGGHLRLSSTREGIVLEFSEDGQDWSFFSLLSYEKYISILNKSYDLSDLKESPELLLS